MRKSKKRYIKLEDRIRVFANKVAIEPIIILKNKKCLLLSSEYKKEEKY